jgi:hypothetical protein
LHCREVEGHAVPGEGGDAGQVLSFCTTSQVHVVGWAPQALGVQKQQLVP